MLNKCHYLYVEIWWIGCRSVGCYMFIKWKHENSPLCSSHSHLWYNYYWASIWAIGLNYNTMHGIFVHKEIFSSSSFPFPFLPPLYWTNSALSQLKIWFNGAAILSLQFLKRISKVHLVQESCVNMTYNLDLCKKYEYLSTKETKKREKVSSRWGRIIK